MQAFFKSDSHIVEWIDLIIEKTITIGMLSGQDCQEDMGKVKSLLQKVLSSLAEEADLDQPMLKEIIKQLLEQRLPDQLLVEHIPGFHESITALLDEAMVDFKNAHQAEPETEQKNLIEEEPLPEAIPSMATQPAYDLPSGSSESDGSLEIRPSLLLIKEEEDEEILKPLIEERIPEIDSTQEMEKDDEESVNNSSKDPMENRMEEKRKERPQVRFKWTAQPPEGLSYVLKNLYPDSQIYWNITLAGYSVLAQVDKLLVVTIQEEERAALLKKLENQGWYIAFCTQDDLLFPRRLERIIRQAGRVSTKTKGSML